VTRAPTRVLVVAESDVFAATLEAALRDEPRLAVVVGRPRALAQLLEEHRPAVVVLASSAAGLRAHLDVVGPRAPALIALVDDPRAAWSITARRAGVHAVLRRAAPLEQIVAAVRAAAVGLVIVPHDVVRGGVESAFGDAGDARLLTAREREILELMAEGLSNRIIARRLGISSHTVKFHVASILAKLRATSRAEAVTIGIRAGLISL
jgi:DNA-binding NarL/FixJ family response regulator